MFWYINKKKLSFDYSRPIWSNVFKVITILKVKTNYLWSRQTVGIIMMTRIWLPANRRNIHKWSNVHFWVDCLQSSHSIQMTKFLKVVVHVIIIDQWNSTTWLYKIQVTYLKPRYSCCCDIIVQCKEGYLKTWTGTLANSADPDQIAAECGVWSGAALFA